MRLKRKVTDSGSESEFFNRKFDEQILKNEKLSLLLLIIIFAIGFFYFMINHFFFDEQIQSLYDREEAFILWTSFLGGMSLYQLLFYFKLIRCHKRYGRIPENVNYIHSFIEISIVTIATWFHSLNFANQVFVFNTPIVNAYYIFTILTILRLSFNLSLFAALFSSASYFSLCIWIFANDTSLKPTEYIHYQLIHYAKGFAMLLSGLASCFVARQIRLSISSSVGNLERSNRIQNLFGQQVSREIADEMVNSNGTIQSKIMKVCVMFIDIRNFSLFAEGKNPEEVVQYQQSFFSTVIEVVQKNKGIINQFLGDGCMITFGTPVELRNPCGNAVNAALELRDEIMKKVTGNRIPPIKFGTGIHYGEAVTGNIGTESRQQYTVTGEVVILASRIEQLNKEFGSEILVSKEVLEFIPENRNLFRSLGIVKVKGKDDGIEVFSATT